MLNNWMQTVVVNNSRNVSWNCSRASFLGWMKCDQRIRLSLLQEAGSLMRIWAFWWLNFEWNALRLRVVISLFGISRSISEAPTNVTFRFVLFVSSEFFIFFFGKVKVAWAIIIGFMTSAHARTLCLWINVFDDNRKLLALEMGTHESRPTALCNFMLCSNYWGKIMGFGAFLMSLSEICSHRACAKSSQQVATISGSVTQPPTLLQISSAYLSVD